MENIYGKFPVKNM